MWAVSSPVLLDSCVLYPMYLRDTLLRMAEVNLYRVHWSQEILEGATRNLIEAGKMTNAKAARLQKMLENAFPEAMVEVPTELVQVMSNDQARSPCACCCRRRQSNCDCDLQS